MNNFCIFSDNRRYRYVLECDGDVDPLFPRSNEFVAWIGLNPSTADENQLDPTLRRIKAFTQSFGFTRFVMLNLFAYRATDPREMKRQADPVGEENDHWIRTVCCSAKLVVFAWGNEGVHHNRNVQVIELLEGRTAHCLGITGNGQPSHPLYLPGNVIPVVYGLHYVRLMG